jgi:hypothetical protein
VFRSNAGRNENKYLCEGINILERVDCLMNIVLYSKEICVSKMADPSLLGSRTLTFLILDAGFKGFIVWLGIGHDGQGAWLPTSSSPALPLSPPVLLPYYPRTASPTDYHRDSTTGM